MTNAIIAKEGRDAAIYNIPGAFLQTKAIIDAIRKLHGSSVDIYLVKDQFGKIIWCIKAKIYMIDTKG